MADTCIVCLGDLRTSLDEDPPSEDAAPVPADDDHDGENGEQTDNSNAKSIDDDDEAIAHLLPCKHDLHNSCLKPWVERANSCPICRTTFNMVEISRTRGGPAVDSYAVENKVQQAELDPTMVIEDELFDVETWEPCLVCGVPDDGYGSMSCDGCDRVAHIFCAGLDDQPDVWYCETCLADLENDAQLPGTSSGLRRRSRRTRGGATATRTRRRRNPDADWARVWQEVSRRLDLDLDFPFDEEVPTDHRTEEQRREFQRWQRRFEVANRQGATNRLRGIAQSRLNPEAPLEPDPESQEELRAWNAFDKARESNDAPLTVRRRKRRAAESPASPHEQEHSEQPQLKKPRLRRPPPIANEQPESSNAAARRKTEEPTFLSSLLSEVENKPVSATSPATSDQVYGQHSPRNSSPVRSPASSECGSPVAASPPPHRPLSPPLSSTIMPITSPVAQTFSPFSPAGSRLDLDQSNGTHHRGRHRLELQNHEESFSMRDRQSSASPSRTLSYSAKEEIQRMVKLALGTRYRDKEISKDQYTDINRDVSRKLYDMVRDASALTDQEERERWQNIANEEVRKSVAVLADASAPDE